MASKKFFTLNNSLKMPSIGIGTWMAPEHEIESALNKAFEAGYRHIDTAPVYLNEKSIGAFLKKKIDSKEIQRDEIFITTKLPPPANRPECVEKTLRKSLKDLQLSYVDMYLIHTPFTVPETDGDFKRDETGEIIVDTTTNHVEIWKKMEEMVKLGLTKSIGISNFNKEQISKILKNATIKPSNLQIEHHAYLQQNELINYCKENEIIVTAYSPLGSKGIQNLKDSAGVKSTTVDILQDEIVLNIAKKYNKTSAQVLLRWIIQRGICAIPKSTNEKRIKENIDIFDFNLTEDDLNMLKTLDKNIRICDFSFFKGVEKHPEFPW